MNATTLNTKLAEIRGMMESAEASAKFWQDLQNEYPTSPDAAACAARYWALMGAYRECLRIFDSE